MAIIQSCATRAKWSRLAKESCNLQPVSVAKYQHKVWRPPWPSLVWSAIVLYHWSRRQPKPWRVSQTWLFEPEGDSRPPHASFRQPRVVLIVYRRVELKDFLVSGKHLLCSCYWQTSKRSLAAFEVFMFDCVRDDMCWDTKKSSRTEIVFGNSLDRRGRAMITSVLYTVSQKRAQLWNGIARNYMDRFWWYLAEIFKSL